MRRTGRKRKTKAASVSDPEKTTIRPRANRMRLSGPMRYREAATDSWNDGELRNISESGVLFAGHGQLAPGTRVELELTMPAQISGSKDAPVICNAEVVRATVERGSRMYAAQIFDYVFISRIAPSSETSAGRRAKCNPN